MVELGRGSKPAKRLIDLTALEPELRFITETADRLTIGALSTHNDVLGSAAFRHDALPLVQACAEVGAPQIRARGTIAGNLVTASPANDTIAALYALDAEVEVASAAGTRAGCVSTNFAPASVRRRSRRANWCVRSRCANSARRGAAFFSSSVCAKPKRSR